MGASLSGSRRTRRSAETVQRTVSTRFLRVPYPEWMLLWTGKKREWRRPTTGAVASTWVAPTPVVLSATGIGSSSGSNCIAVVTHHSLQHLHDIADDDEALEREGFDSYDAFRDYWRGRTHKPYKPLAKVEVFRIDPWTKAWREACASALLNALYGEYL